MSAARLRLLGLALAVTLGACGGGGGGDRMTGPVTLERVAKEGWFDRCPAADAALAGLAPTTAGRPLEPLGDVLPTSADGFEAAVDGPVAAADPALRPWLIAGLQSAGAGDGYSAAFSHGAGGTGGGWSAFAFPHPDAAAVRTAVTNAYTALVCTFDGEPFTVPGAVAAATRETAQVLWTSGGVLFVAEAADRTQAEAAAAAVRARLAG